MYKTVLFDLDGTLLNTIQDLADAANYVCLENGWPTHTLQEYKRFVGNGIPTLCSRFSPPQHRSPQQLSATLAAFSARYNAHKQDSTAPYPGIPALLAHLKQQGVAMGVLSNKEDTLAQAVVQHYFPGVFARVQGAQPGVPIKPDPAGVHSLLQRMGATTQHCLFVGDSDVDVFTAQNSGLASSGVLWGFRTETELRQAGAVHIAPTPADLEKIILGKAL